MANSSTQITMTLYHIDSQNKVVISKMETTTPHGAMQLTKNKKESK